MKKYQLIAIATLVVFGFVLTAQAKTVTEGTLDVERLATQISDNLADYSQKKDELVGNIASVQKGIRKLKEDYEKAESVKQRTMIKARTLKETSRLLDFYSQFYALNVEKVKAILPKLERMKSAAKKSALGKAARKLQDPEFKRGMKSLYVNLSAMALMFNPNSKKEIANLLKENELLYRQEQKGVNVFDNIVKNVDKVSDYLRSVYARTMLRSRVLQQKKAQTELAVELMRYVLALKPIQQTMLQINAEGVIGVPDIDFEEFVDPLLSDNQAEDWGEDIYSDPDTDSILTDFQQNGPKFLR